MVRCLRSLKQPATDTFKSIGKSVVGLYKNSFKPTLSYIVGDWIPSIANGFSETFAPIFQESMPVIMDEWAKNFKNSV